MIACNNCGSVNVKLYKHTWVNKMSHVKLNCEDCFSSYHVDKGFMKFTVGELNDEMILIQKTKRKFFLRRVRCEGI